MEMGLKGTILALLTVAGATLVTAGEYLLRVGNKNDSVVEEKTFPPGSSLKLHCCLTNNTSNRCYISWHFQPSGKNQTGQNMGICSKTKPRCNICENEPCSISNINESNIGWYHCEVKIEIPELYTSTSSKIKVTMPNVMEKTTIQSQATRTTVGSKEGHKDNWWIWIAVGASSFILIVLVMLVICAVQKRPCNKSMAEEPIYINTRVKPSPRLMPPAEQLKTVSSCQDLQTPSSARRYEDRNHRYKR